MGNTIMRTIRFTIEENKDIEQFLKANPFLDFSTLTRLALAEFIRNPILKINPLNEKGERPKAARQEVRHV